MSGILSFGRVCLFFQKKPTNKASAPPPSTHTNEKRKNEATKIYLSGLAGIQPRLAFRVRHKQALLAKSEI